MLPVFANVVLGSITVGLFFATVNLRRRAR